MKPSQVQAIDAHAHYGLYTRTGHKMHETFMTGDANEVVRRARNSRIVQTIVSPLLGLLPRGEASAEVGNNEAWDIVSRTEGLLQYVIVNPLEKRTYDQAREMLGQRKCVGIKIHPEEHRYPIKEHGRAIFEFASKLDEPPVIMTHSGEQLSMPQDFIPFTNDFPQVKLLLAHIGCGWDGDPTHQIRAIQMSKRGNVYADTSSAQSITPGLIEWAVKEVGVDRVLFGTDTPLYSVPMQRARIDGADLSDHDKRQILRENALRLFGPNLARHCGENALATASAF